MREQLKTHGLKALGAHERGLDKLMEELNAGNLEVAALIPKYTVPVLSLVIPKKVEEARTITRVHINLGNASPETQRLWTEAEEPQPVEYTIGTPGNDDAG